MSNYGLSYLLASVEANGARIEECDFGKLIVHPTIKWPIFNYAIVEHEAVSSEEVAQEFTSRGLQPSILAPSDALAELATSLQLEPHEEHTVLHANARDVLLAGVPQVEELAACLTNDVKTWLDTLLAGFEAPEQLWPRFHQAHSRIYQGDERAHLHLACLDGQPVGAALLWVAEGIAGVNTAAIVPQYRGNGAYKALFRSRVEQALNMGLQVLATETAIPAVVHVAQKFGFRPVHSYRLWY